MWYDNKFNCYIKDEALCEIVLDVLQEETTEDFCKNYGMKREECIEYLYGECCKYVKNVLPFRSGLKLGSWLWEYLATYEAEEKLDNFEYKLA